MAYCRFENRLTATYAEDLYAFCNIHMPALVLKAVKHHDTVFELFEKAVQKYEGDVRLLVIGAISPLAKLVREQRKPVTIAHTELSITPAMKMLVAAADRQRLLDQQGLPSAHAYVLESDLPADEGQAQTGALAAATQQNLCRGQIFSEDYNYTSEQIHPSTRHLDKEFVNHNASGLTPSENMVASLGSTSEYGIQSHAGHSCLHSWRTDGIAQDASCLGNQAATSLEHSSIPLMDGMGDFSTQDWHDFLNVDSAFMESL